MVVEERLCLLPIPRRFAPPPLLKGLYGINRGEILLIKGQPKVLQSIMLALASEGDLDVN